MLRARTIGEAGAKVQAARVDRGSHAESGGRIRRWRARAAYEALHNFDELTREVELPRRAERMVKNGEVIAMICGTPVAPKARRT